MSLEPLTVVICTDHAAVNGGQARVAIESALGLARRGARPIVFSATAPVDPRLAAAGVEVIALGQHDLRSNPSRAAALVQGTWNRAAAAALNELLARLPRERTVAHVHGWAGALSPAIAGPIRSSGLPAVFTIHDYSMFCPNGAFYNYQSNAVCELTPLSLGCIATNCDARSYPRSLWRAGRLFMAQHYAGLPRAFSDYICVSKFQNTIVAPYLPKAVGVHCVANPIDVEDIGPKQTPASGEVIFVGRLSPEKGALLFAEAADRAGVAPTFLGDGPVAAELRRRFPNAVILGWQTPERTRQRMRNARALVFPSVWYEGQPLTVLEAKALGTPVVVSDLCAAREAIEDGVDGLWFKSAEVSALAEALARIKDDAFVTRLSRAAYESFWRDPPTLDAHAARLAAVYDAMIDRRRTAAAVSQP